MYLHSQNPRPSSRELSRRRTIQPMAKCHRMMWGPGKCFSWVETTFDGIERVFYGAENISCKLPAAVETAPLYWFSILTPQSKLIATVLRSSAGGSLLFADGVLGRVGIMQTGVIGDTFAPIFSFSRTTTATDQATTARHYWFWGSHASQRSSQVALRECSR